MSNYPILPGNIVASTVKPGKHAPAEFFTMFCDALSSGATMFVTYTDELPDLVTATQIVVEPAAKDMFHLPWNRLDGFSLAGPTKPVPPSGLTEARMTDFFASYNADYQLFLAQIAAINDAAGKTMSIEAAKAEQPRQGEFRASTKKLVTVIRLIQYLDPALFPSVLFTIYDGHEDLNASDPATRSAVLNAIRGNTISCDHGRHAVHFALPASAVLHKDVIAGFVEIPFPLPTLDELAATVIPYMLMSCDKSSQDYGPHTPEIGAAMARACLGLGRRDAEQVAASAMTKLRKFNHETVAAMARAKCDRIKSGGILTFLTPQEQTRPQDLAGTDNLMAKMRTLARGYSEHATALNLSKPTGIVITGISGTGKTASAEAAGAIFSEVTGQAWPVVRVDMGAMFGGLMGQTEANWRKTIAQLRVLGGCIAIFDEWEKISAGANGTSSSSGGDLMRRLYGSALTWLNDKKKTDDRTFVFMTMNDVTGITPEFFQRFNAVFFADLPDQATVRKIIEINFKNQLGPISKTCEDLNWSKADWEQAVKGCENFSGREIMTCVETSRLLADERKMAFAIPAIAQFMEVVREAAVTITHASDAATIESLRQWGRTKATSIHKSADVPTITVRPVGQGRKIT